MSPFEMETVSSPIGNPERRKGEMESALSLSNGKLRMALDVGKLGSWERDFETGEVIGTPTFKTHLGLPSNAPLTYEALQGIIHPDDRGRIDQAIVFSIKTKTDFQVEHRVVRPNGEIGRLLVRGGAIYDKANNPTRVMGVTQDVTERDKIKEEMSLAHKRWEFLRELNDQLAGLDDPHAIMETAARDLAGFLQVESTGYGEVFEDRGIVTVEREWASGIISNEGRVYQLTDLPPEAFALIKQGYSLRVEDVKKDPNLSDPRLQDFYSCFNIRSFLSVPLLRGSHLKAIFYIHSSAPRAWTNEDIALVQDVAARTWITIEKARMTMRLREAEARLQKMAPSQPS